MVGYTEGGGWIYYARINDTSTWPSRYKQACLKLFLSVDINILKLYADNASRVVKRNEIQKIKMEILSNFIV